MVFEAFGFQIPAYVKLIATRYPSMYVNMYAIMFCADLLYLLLLLDIIDLVLTIKNPFYSRANRIKIYKFVIIAYVVLYTYFYWNL